MTEKVGLAQQVRAEFPLAPTLEVLGLARSTWYYRTRRQRAYTAKHGHLRRPLERIAQAHPEYGYRRTTTELRETHGHVVNHKVVQRLHQAWGLPLVRGTRLPRPSGIRRVITMAGERANLVVARSAIGPFEVVYTDFTELPYGGGIAQLILLLDHHTKLALGWAVGHQAITELALLAWRRTKATLRRLGRSPAGLVVHHDQDPVFTSYGWTGQLLLRDEARISYALGGAKDNPEMESFNSRFKTENRSLLLDAVDLAELIRLVSRRMRYYNRVRRHSTLGNQAPWTYVQSLRTPD